MALQNIMIDIDGTICEDIPNERSDLFLTAKLKPNAVESVNKLYDGSAVIVYADESCVHTNHSTERGEDAISENIITIFTARKEEHREVTTEWLNKNGFKYHNLLMNKPRGGNYIWIDNLSVKGIHYKNNWDKVMTQINGNKIQIENDLVKSQINAIKLFHRSKYP